MRQSVVFAAVLAMVAAAASGSLQYAAGAASQPRWVVQASPTASDLNDVSCSTPTQCFAVGAHATVIKTINGGRTWRAIGGRRTGMDSSTTFVSVRCPAPGVCLLLADPNVVIRTTDGGRSWQAHVIALRQGLARLRKLACPTARVCFATASPVGPSALPFTGSPIGRGVGGYFQAPAAIYKTENGGSSWRRLSVPASVPCPGDCTGSDLQGKRFHLVRVPYDLQWISCGDAMHCRAGGDSFIGSHQGYAGSVLRTDDGGRRWSLVDAGIDPNIATCPTLSVCTGIFYQPQTPNDSVELMRSTHAGAAWTGTTIGSFDWASNITTGSVLTAIACTGPTFCELAGPHGTLAMAIGTRLFKQRSPTAADLTAVACPRMGACYAVGAGGTVVARRSMRR